MSDPVDSLVLTLSTSPAVYRTQMVEDFEKNEVIRPRETMLDAGGKGVFASRVLRQLGIPTKHMSTGGINQQEFCSLLDHDGFPYYLAPSSSRIRNCITILEIDPEKSDVDAPWIRTVTELNEAVPEVDAKTPTVLFEHVLGSMDEAFILLVSGSLAPGFDRTFYAQVVKESLDRGMFVICDSVGQEMLHVFEHQPQMVKMSLTDFAAAFLPEKSGFIEHCEESHSDSHRSMVFETLVDMTEDTRTSIIITRGQRDIWYATNGETGVHHVHPVAKGRFMNPVGSADAFAAGLAAWVHSHATRSDLVGGLGNQDLEQAISMASRCAQENARIIRPGRIR